jgi:hypothetical protein
MAAVLVVVTLALKPPFESTPPVPLHAMVPAAGLLMVQPDISVTKFGFGWRFASPGTFARTYSHTPRRLVS